jgi:hypothetical protein
MTDAVEKVQNCPVIIFPAISRSDGRPPICVAITLPRSPVSLSSGDEGPRHFYTKVASTAQRIFGQQYKKTFSTASTQKGHSPRVPDRTCRSHGTPFQSDHLRHYDAALSLRDTTRYARHNATPLARTGWSNEGREGHACRAAL